MVTFRRGATYDRPARSTARKVLIAFNILLATILVVGVAGFGYFDWRWNQLGRLSLNSLRDDPGEAVNVLMVGSDSRENITAEEEESYGSTADAGGQRSDTIMILHVDPRQEKASILSIPRDTWVLNSNTGRNSRINEAFSEGPNGLINTITDNFNIPIDHYAEVDFDGFKGVVDSIGGVEIPFAAPARDHNSGLNVPTAGCVKLTGDQALAYARSRYYETKLNGRWVSDPRSDLSRIDRQQDFIRRVIREAVSSASNPLTLNALISDGVQNVTLDDGFGAKNVFDIARRFRSLDSNTVEMMTLPTTGANRGGASVLIPNEDEVPALVDRFLNGPPENQPLADIPVSSISLRVLNGSGISGQAAEASAGLKDVGFIVNGTGDGNRRAESVVQYAPGSEDKARVIASYIGGGATVSENTSLDGVDAVLTTGANFTGIIDPTTPTTTTQAPPTTEAPATTTTTSPFVPSGDC